MHTEINPSDVFKPNAPTSLATVTRGENFIHISGQMPVDEAGKVVSKGDPTAQCERVIQNMLSVVRHAGGTASDVCKMTVYLLDRRHLPNIMEVRKTFFQEPYPATTVVVVAGLASPDWLVEIEGVAVIATE